MATELEFSKSLAKEIETQMGLLEEKVTHVSALVSRLKSEKEELVRERNELAGTVRSLQDRLSEVDMDAVERKLNALNQENEQLQAERQDVARRIGELLDKLDHLST
jgi:chromosome segregation ATPase